MGALVISAIVCFGVLIVGLAVGVISTVTLLGYRLNLHTGAPPP